MNRHKPYDVEFYLIPFIFLTRIVLIAEGEDNLLLVEVTPFIFLISIPAFFLFLGVAHFLA